MNMTETNSISYSYSTSPKTSRNFTPDHQTFHEGDFNRVFVFEAPWKTLYLNSPNIFYIEK